MFEPMCRSSIFLPRVTIWLKPEYRRVIYASRNLKIDNSSMYVKSWREEKSFSILAWSWWRSDFWETKMAPSNMKLLQITSMNNRIIKWYFPENYHVTSYFHRRSCCHAMKSKNLLYKCIYIHQWFQWAVGQPSPFNIIHLWSNISCKIPLYT